MSECDKRVYLYYWFNVCAFLHIVGMFSVFQASVVFMKGIVPYALGIELKQSQP